MDFRRDVMPILAGKCTACHSEWDSPVRLTADQASASAPGVAAQPFNRSYESLLDGVQKGEGRHVHPGQARTSPLIWRLYGRNTSRPWDRTAGESQTVSRMPPDGSPALTDDERRTFVEWIDLGTTWDGPPTTQGPGGP